MCLIWDWPLPLRPSAAKNLAPFANDPGRIAIELHAKSRPRISSGWDGWDWKHLESMPKNFPRILNGCRGMSAGIGSFSCWSFELAPEDGRRIPLGECVKNLRRIPWPSSFPPPPPFHFPFCYVNPEGSLEDQRIQESPNFPGNLKESQRISKNLKESQGISENLKAIRKNIDENPEESLGNDERILENLGESGGNSKEYWQESWRILLQES